MNTKLLRKLRGKHALRIENSHLRVGDTVTCVFFNDHLKPLDRKKQIHQFWGLLIKDIRHYRKLREIRELKEMLLLIISTIRK